MREEKHENQLVGTDGVVEVDNTNQDELEESKTFDGTHLSHRRCAVCGRPLVSYDFHGFNVLYCERDKKPVCRICRHPSIELASVETIHCTNDKCPAYQKARHKNKGASKDNESA